MKCKGKVEAKAASSKKMKNATLFKGSCPKCGCKIATFGKL